MLNYSITTILITNMHKSLSSMPQESSLFTRHFDSSTTWRTMYSFQGDSSASLTQLRMEHEIIAWLSPSQWDFLLGVSSSPTIWSWLFCMECHSFIFTCGAWLEVVFEFEWEQPILVLEVNLISTPLDMHQNELNGDLPQIKIECDFIQTFDHIPNTHQTWKVTYAEQPNANQ